MTGGGVEATSRSDEFASHAHAQDHLASGLLVIAGGLNDVFEGADGRAGVEEVQDGLAMR